MDMSDKQPQQAEPQTQTFTKAQTWAALKKCWRGYRIAKSRSDNPRMIQYAERIRKLQGELAIAVSEFPNIGLTN
jgi:hypothetical protein